MKIACISASRVPSSTANSIQVMKACQALAQLDHEVRLYVPAAHAGGLTHGSPWEELASWYGLHTSFDVVWLAANPRLRRYDFSWKAVRQAQAWGARMLVAWPLQAGLIGLLFGLPVLLELHGPPEGAFGPWLFRLLVALPGRKRFMPITHALRQMLEQEFPSLRRLARQKTTSDLWVIAPNGVDLDRYQHLPDPLEARKTLGLPEIFTVGYTGHLYPGRGTGLLLELSRRFPQVQFLWVGGQPADVQTWQARLVQERVGNVTLTGFVPNQALAQYQAAAEILLMPYERHVEGSSGGNSASYCSPMKMFEYMACGRAILSSDLPVIREILNPENAVLCPPGDVAAWTGALAALMDDPQRRQALAQAAWRDVQRYTWPQRARSALAGFLPEGEAC